jgi:hypothetical protein
MWRLCIFANFYGARWHGYGYFDWESVESVMIISRTYLGYSKIILWLRYSWGQFSTWYSLFFIFCLGVEGMTRDMHDWRPFHRMKILKIFWHQKIARSEVHLWVWKYPSLWLIIAQIYCGECDFVQKRHCRYRPWRTKPIFVIFCWVFFGMLSFIWLKHMHVYQHLLSCCVRIYPMVAKKVCFSCKRKNKNNLFFFVQLHNKVDQPLGLTTESIQFGMSRSGLDLRTTERVSTLNGFLLQWACQRHFVCTKTCAAVLSLPLGGWRAQWLDRVEMLHYV